MLVENLDSKIEEFVDVEDCRLFKFPFDAKEGAKVTLYALKMLKFYELLSSSENSCVATDSVFNIMESNKEHFSRTVFRKTVENSGGFAENDPMKIAFDGKSKCSVLLCSSVANNSS